jgi:hypothetical protein
LYEADLDVFPVGNNQCVGSDGWKSNDNSAGAQSIDAELIPPLLQTA